MPSLPVSVEWENLDEAFAELEQECTEVARGISVLLWQSILTKTPQRFGGMTASWSYTYSASNFRDRSQQVKPEELAADNMWRTDYYSIKYRGHPNAIMIANAASAGRDTEFRLGRKVYLTNGVDHGEGPYSMWVEANPDKLRRDNQPGRPLARSLDMIQSRFGRDVSRDAATKLRTLKIGGGYADGNS